MNRILPAFAVSAALFASCSLASAPATAATSAGLVRAQSHGDPAPRTKGVILRGPVDQLIARIGKASAEEGKAAPYASTVAEAAQILCAMGHCHRFYVGIDHPRIRATLGVLIAGRRTDGSFGNAANEAPETTAWVVDALSVMDADRYRDEIAMARGWLGKHGVDGSAWDRCVAKVRSQLRQDVYPEHLAKDAAAYVSALQENANAAPNLAEAVPALLQLVASQQANRELDQGQDPAAQKAAFSAAQQKGFDFLMAQLQDGKMLVAYGDKKVPDPAITGFAMLALQTKPSAQRTSKEAAVVDQGMRWLLAGQNEDGSFGQQVQNYTTSVVIGALVRWGAPEAKTAIEKAQRYVLSCQNLESGGYQPSDRDYGSIGYGGSQRGDLSNVHFALQALRESGLQAEHEAFQKALVFLQRSQNLKSVNDFSGKVSDPDAGGKLMDVTSGDDGGAAYYPGNSAAGYAVTPDGKSQPRSYGSMTYSLLKSYTLCGIAAGDERVQAAVRWIGENWTLDENPGFVAVPAGDKARYSGLFYYYMVLAQALDLAKVDTVQKALPKDAAAGAKPERIDWRKALREHLTSLQQADGSFVNAKNSRWMESMPVLCTCYSMLALELCR